VHVNDLNAAGGTEESGATSPSAPSADFRALFEAAPAAYLVLGTDAPRYTVVAASDAYLRATLVARDAVVGAGVFDVHPDANPANPTPTGVTNLRTSLDTVLRTAMPHRMPIQRYDVRGPGGEWDVRYWAPRNIPVLGPDGAVRYLLHEVEDVTAQELEQARVKEALEATEADFRRVFDAIDAAFHRCEVITDAEGRAVDYRLLAVNPAWARMTGMDPATSVGRTARELVPDAPAAWIDACGRAGLQRETVRVEQEIPALDMWFDVHLVPFGTPDSRQFIAMAADITARKRGEAERARLVAELDAERERLHAVILGMPAPLALAEGPEHRFTLVNEAFKRVSGGGRDITGLTPRTAFPELEGSGVYELFDRVYETGEPWLGPETLVRYDRDGTGIQDTWWDLRYEPVRDAGGRVVGVLNFGVDVTMQVQARRAVEGLLSDSERARAEARGARDRAEVAGREAEAASHAKSGFLATMSHEFRTPVNAIIGYTQLLEMGLAGSLSESQRDYVDRLTTSSRHLLSLVNDVLDLSKIEAGETRVARADGWTGPPAAIALDLVRPQASARGVRLVDERENEAGVPYVGDDARVRQVVLNLLSNAVKFTERGGTVTLGSGTVATTPVVGGYLQGDGPWAYLRVTDTGIGIAPEEQGRVFQPFHQVTGGHTRTAGGTGLGLAISRRLARLMGGDLTVESQPGAGSSFTLWLPAARRVGARAPAETAAARSTRADHGVLDVLHGSGLGQLGELLHSLVDEILEAYVARLRVDPAIPPALRRTELEDHAVSFLADLSQSLVIVGEAGPEAVELLRDGSAIQRTIAERHGARRCAQGFDEAAVRRDHRIFRDEVERAVMGRLRQANDGEGDDVQGVLHALLGLVDRAESISIRAWQQASSSPQTSTV